MDTKLLKTEQTEQGTGASGAPEAAVKKRSGGWKKELLAFVCLLLALAVFCAASAAVLIPKRFDYGATWTMYEKEPKNSVDALFFGSSLVYCDLVPSVIYEENGVASYLMAGPEQTIPVTYRYLRQACRTQSPKVVYIEATGLLFARYNRSVKINLTYLPPTLGRLISTFREAEQDDWTGLAFPLYAYHSRWKDLENEDWVIGLGGSGTDPLAGYTFLDRAAPMGEPSDRGYEIDPDTYARNMEYAGKIVDFCRSQNIKPVFFLAPCIHQPSPELQAQMESELTAVGAEFWNCNDYMDSPELDYSVDFFDTLHFNYRGADKFSRYFARRMAEDGLSPTQGADEALWQERIDRFSALRAEWDSQPVRPQKGGTAEVG